MNSEAPASSGAPPGTCPSSVAGNAATLPFAARPARVGTVRAGMGERPFSTRVFTRDFPKKHKSGRHSRLRQKRLYQLDKIL